MPQHIGLNHDRFLDWFLENDRMKSLEKGAVFTFGLRESGFIFALEKRLRLDTFEDDFGVSGYFIEINKQQDYFLLNRDNHLLESTRRIYNVIFTRHFGSTQRCDFMSMRQYDAQLLIPQLADT
jgi:hypothetical protein